MDGDEIRAKIKVGSRVCLRRGVSVYKVGVRKPVRRTMRPQWVDVNLITPRGMIGWIGTGGLQFRAGLEAVEDIEDLS